tara:strand:- start:3223 stop:3645 length:423 start_codon:yes stop_codon:yes gene_type:complete
MNKIFLAISVVVNLTLIAAVVGILEFFLAASVVIIIVLAWYIRRQAIELNTISSDFDSFYEQLDAYEKHIDQIHGLEMFYGDQTLQGLIRHSREMLNNIYDIQTKYFIEEEEEIDRTEKEKNQEAEKESILYRSPSRSDS